jgi:hypothetical protein
MDTDGAKKNYSTGRAQAGHYANHSMRNIGRVPPTLFLIGANGLVMFIPDNLADDSAPHVHRPRRDRNRDDTRSLDEVHPVRYDEFPLRVRPSQPQGWKQLRWLHQRPSQTFYRTRSRQRAFNCGTSAVQTHLLRSLL